MRATRSGGSEISNDVMALIGVAVAVAVLAYAAGAVGRGAAVLGAALRSARILLEPGRGVIDIGSLGALDVPRIVMLVLALIAVAAVVRMLLRRRRSPQPEMADRQQ